eukprot:COSAG01_NODE_23268_length_821_cov_1.973684_1_plen_176_part_00
MSRSCGVAAMSWANFFAHSSTSATLPPASGGACAGSSSTVQHTALVHTSRSGFTPKNSSLRTWWCNGVRFAICCWSAGWPSGWDLRQGPGSPCFGARPGGPLQPLWRPGGLLQPLWRQPGRGLSGTKPGRSAPPTNAKSAGALGYLGSAVYGLMPKPWQLFQDVPVPPGFLVMIR